MISSLLHLVGLRPRVYYTLSIFKGGGGQEDPLPHPHQYTNELITLLCTFSQNIAIHGLSENEITQRKIKEDYVDIDRVQSIY